MSNEEREKYACKVCGNCPDEEGELRHGRGCYVLDEDGGGSEYFPECIEPPSLPPNNPVATGSGTLTLDGKTYDVRERK